MLEKGKRWFNENAKTIVKIIGIGVFTIGTHFALDFLKEPRKGCLTIEVIPEDPAEIIWRAWGEDILNRKRKLIGCRVGKDDDTTRYLVKTLTSVKKLHDGEYD